jgi:DNA-binding NarL/FixJ family response regulator
MPVTVLVADDDEMSRDIARRAIQEAVDVVGEVTDYESAIRLARELRPDLMLVDIDLPGGGGVLLTHRIKALQPGIRVILMTGHDEEAYLSGTGRGGADALLPKKNVRTEALFVVCTVARDLLRRWDGKERRRAPSTWNGRDRRNVRGRNPGRGNQSPGGPMSPSS